jgi:hypothetical protein
MKITAFAICILLMSITYAQDSRLIFIEAGKNISDVLTPQKIYLYPKFINGKILFRDGTISEAALNYNYLNGELEFIAPNKDTLAIAKNQMLNIKKVVIDTNFFFYNRGYLQQVMEGPEGRLLKRQMFDVVKREKIGGYNQPTSTSAIESYGSFTDNYGVFSPSLKIKENITLALKTDYFFNDQYNLLLPANKKNLYKVYPSKRNQIDKYLEQNSVDFRNSVDLEKLFAFLANGIN